MNRKLPTFFVTRIPQLVYSKNMKFALLIPFILLLGLVIGGWAPKEELRAAKKEAADLAAKLADRNKDLRMDTFASFVKIPERAKNPKSKPAAQAAAITRVRVPSTNATPNAVTAAPSVTPSAEVPPAQKPQTEEPLKPEDMRARIDEAKELWKTRVEVARAQWLDRLKLSPEETALFDDAINTMNDNLYGAIQRFADGLAAGETLTPETGVRAFSEMTASLVQTYDDLSAFVPEAQRGEAAQIELTDFIDPAVAEPLIAVQDQLEKLPPERRPMMRFRR